MNELLEAQWKHTVMVARFILAGTERHYKFTWGDAYRDPRATFPYSSPRSLHAMRLAVDINAFDSTGRMLETDEDWWELSEIWLALGGVRIAGDSNHLSVGWGGRK